MTERVTFCYPDMNLNNMQCVCIMLCVSMHIAGGKHEREHVS